MKPARLLIILWALLIAVALTAQIPEPVNIEAIEKIKTEARSRRSQVKDVARALTNVYGARLTNSPNIKAAGEYARKKLMEWRLDDVHLEPWSFGNGWTNEKFSLKLVSDPSFSLVAYPKAWTPGTSGPFTAEAVEAIIQNEADFDRLRGKLRGKFALILPVPPPRPPMTTANKRFTDDELKAQSIPVAAPQTPAPATAQAATEPEAEAGFFAWVENALSAEPAKPVGPVQPPPRPAGPATLRITRERVTAFYQAEGVAAMIEPGPGADGSVLAVTATGEATPWKKDPKLPRVPPQVVVTADHYRKILDLAKQPNPVLLELEIRNSYHSQDPNSFNVVADIKGTDKADQLVILGAHLDSWHLSKGATDNAAGVAVVMEAVRILKAVALPMRRTVRLGLWTGEEQGMLGSRAFVDKYFINRLIYQTRPGHSKPSVYFNVDNGTGAIRGLYLQGNSGATAILQAWMNPLKDLGVSTLSTRNPGSSDHLAFDGAGLPGFQFLQDPIEYETRTHHTNLDTFDQLLEEDLSTNAAIVASFVYMAANRDEPLPRKPLPKSIKPAGSPVP